MSAEGEVRLLGIDGIPEVRPGDDLAALIADAIEASDYGLERGDVVVVTHKIVSKAEGQVIDLCTVEPSTLARQIGERWSKDSRKTEIVLREAQRIVRMHQGMIIAETAHGFICANAGVDASNAAPESVVLLPKDPDASAAALREAFAKRFGFALETAPAVIVSDSFGRPWRHGIVNVAVGVSGMAPLVDYRGQQDSAGYELSASILAVADEVASAAELVIRVVAPEAWLLIVARTMQGTGAALATPCVIGLIVSLFAEGPLRRKAIGIYTVVGGAGTAIGLLIIGVLGTVGSWRLVLLLSGVIGLALLVCAPAVIPETPRRSGRFDLAGALVATLGLVAIVYALANSPSGGWRDGRVIGFFVAGLLLFGLFVLITKRSRQPLLDLGLFADRSRVGAYLVLALMPGTEIGLFFFLSQYFQLVLGYTPLIVALAFLSVSVGMFGTAGVAVRLHPKIGGRYVVAIGALVLLVANLWLLRMDVGDGYWLAVLPSLLLVGMGIAFTTIPATIHATSGVESDCSGSASSVMSAVQNIGSSLSLAIIVAVATTVSTTAARNPPAGMPQDAVDGYAFGEAMWATFVTGAVFSVITALAATLIRRGAARQRTTSDVR